ncbi:UNVERIFIED_CONTAM: hypothetical protein GTU68_001969 [Idotea baltica]|nr:hypothetical protein [Idotea baltica]
MIWAQTAWTLLSWSWPLKKSSASRFRMMRLKPSKLSATR